MKDAQSFEHFVRSLQDDSGPFKVREIKKESDTEFTFLMDLDTRLKERAARSPELKALAGPVPEDDDGPDVLTIVSFLPQGSTLSIRNYVETGVPVSAYGWLMTCLNHIHLPGQSYTARVAAEPPQEGDEVIKLLASWEVGLYDDDLFSMRGLRMLRTLISGMLYRLSFEGPAIAVQLTRLYRQQFPSGGLN